MRALLVVVAVSLGLLRVLGLFGTFEGLNPVWLQVFKDAAHLFVGGVIGAAIACRLIRTTVGQAMLASSSEAPSYHKLAAVFHTIRPWHTFLVKVAVTLSVLETVCAVLSLTVLKR